MSRPDTDDDGTGPEHWPARTDPAPAPRYASPALARLVRQDTDPTGADTGDVERCLVAGPDHRR